MRISKVFLSVFLFLATPVLAMDDEKILTFINDGTETELTLSDLEEMGETNFTTTTIWTRGAHEYTGVSLFDFVQAMDLEGVSLRATAIIDYSAEIPADDAVEGGGIIAYRVDGETISVREKGPLWIVYPYDDNPDFQTEEVYAKSVWQLTTLEVVHQ